MSTRKPDKDKPQQPEKPTDRPAPGKPVRPTGDINNPGKGEPPPPPPPPPENP